MKEVCKDSELDSTLKIDKLKSVLYAISFAGSGNEDCIHADIDTHEFLNNLMIIIYEGKDNKIVMPALESVANIVTGNTYQVQ